MRDRPQPATEGPPAAPGPGGGVLRNTTWLVAAQVLAAPVSMLVNVATARVLGPGDFGHVYLALTLASFAFLVVEWGQGTVLPALVARAPGRHGALLGTALAWRAAVGGAVTVLLAAGATALTDDPALQLAVALVALATGLGALARAYLDASRGFERTDLAAMGAVGQPVITAALVLPALLLGGRLVAVLVAQAAAAGLGLLAVAVTLRPTRPARLSVRRDALRPLLSEGAPFLLLGVVLALQVNVDTLLLARLAPAEAMGWQAAALKLVGVLLFPANALITSLYPTLSRLHGEDREAYQRTARSGLRAALFLGVPLALGCGLYPDIGIWLFNRGTFGPAEDNLRVLAPYLLLLYLAMALGCCLSAAGRQRAWALGQLLCVAVSLALNPLLIPWFQARTGNGGLGVCVTLGLSEALMVGLGLWLVPRGVVEGSLLRSLGRALLAGGAMAVLARFTGGWAPCRPRWWPRWDTRRHCGCSPERTGIQLARSLGALSSRSR